MWIFAFASHDLDLWVCVAGFATMGLGLSIWISGFGSLGLSLRIYIDGIGLQDMDHFIWSKDFNLGVGVS